ncbi:MAG: ferritin family protein [Candidatus Omnitrophica bacterium]|nr:ferritin family protein [Candidatus Omnitrophota bacterium]
MNIKFNLNELLDIAIDVEKAGAELYESLAEKSVHEDTKAMWRYLKEQEEDHAAKFMDIKKAFFPEDSTNLGSGGYDEYMYALARGYVFSKDKISKAVKYGFKADLDAIEFAIEIEKESLLVYIELKDCIADNAVSVIENIISEEKDHLTQLTAIKHSMLDR